MVYNYKVYHKELIYVMEKSFAECKFVLKPWLQPYEEQLINNGGMDNWNVESADFIYKHWDTICAYYDKKTNHGWYKLLLSCNANARLMHQLGPLCDKEAPMHKNNWWRLYNINHTYRIHWGYLLRNPHSMTIDIINRNWDWLMSDQDITNCSLLKRFDNLCGNTNPRIFDLIERHWDTASVIIIRMLADDGGCNYLFKNPNAVDFIERHWDTFICNNTYLYGICDNPNAIALIDTHWDELKAIDKINPYMLAMNPNAANLIDRRWNDFIYITSIPRHPGTTLNSQMDSMWICLCDNQFMDKLVIKHLTEIPNNRYMTNHIIFNIINSETWDNLVLTENVNWSDLWSNPNPAAVELIDRYWNLAMPYIHFRNITEEKEALLDKHWDDVSIILLNGIAHPNMNMHSHISFHMENKLCLPLIEKHLDWFIDNNQIDWWSFAQNPGIFDDEYRVIATKWFRSSVTAELMAAV